MLNAYGKKEIAAMAFAAGLLSGMVVAFSSCSGPVSHESHVTTISHP